MGRQADLTPMSSGSSITLEEHRERRRPLRHLDVRLKPRTNRGVPRSLTPKRRPASTAVQAIVDRTALTTSLMRQVAKVDIWEACGELREGGETSSRCSTDGR